MSEHKLFRTLNHVRCTLAAWRVEYNCERPHTSLDYRTPQEFKLANHNHLYNGENSSYEWWSKRGQVTCTGLAIPVVSHVRWDLLTECVTLC